MNLIWAKQLPVEPGASVCPMTVGRCGGNAERFGCVAEVDSGEVAKLNELRRERIKRIETFECFVESEKLVSRHPEKPSSSLAPRLMSSL